MPEINNIPATVRDLKEGQKFRFVTDSEKTIRTACQIGKTEIYCPHQNSSPYDENEVYLMGNQEVILIN